MSSTSCDTAELRKIFGTEEPPLELTVVQAADFQIVLSSGQISRISWRGTELLRGVTYLVRNKDWATPSPDVKHLPVSGDEIVRLQGRINEPEIAFSYELAVRQIGDDSLRIETRGRALQDFDANRVGLTLLHPVPTCCGRDLIVRHGGGGVVQTGFPVQISPAQPVFDIAGLEHTLEQCRVGLAFDAKRPNGQAEFFEMEDQRNWGDASYKTYIGSLRDPWPFQVKNSDEFLQSVTIKAEKVSAESAPAVIRAVNFSGWTKDFICPDVAVSVPLNGAQQSLNNVQKYGFFRPSRLSAYLRTDRIDPVEINALAHLGRLTSCPITIELEVHGDNAQGLAGVASALGAAAVVPDSVLAVPVEYTKSYQPDADWPQVMPLEDFYALTRAVFPHSRIGGGMVTYFTELNRKWPPAIAIDYVAHAYCPIVHAADDTTVLQNLETLPLIAQSVQERLPGVPHEIVSALISMRQNPYGAQPVQNAQNRRMAMAATDPRESAEFGALWMFEVVQRLARTDVRIVTLGALAGSASIYSQNAASGRLPAYFALEKLCQLQGTGEDNFNASKLELMKERCSAAMKFFDPVPAPLGARF